MVVLKIELSTELHYTSTFGDDYRPWLPTMDYPLLIFVELTKARNASLIDAEGSTKAVGHWRKNTCAGVSYLWHWLTTSCDWAQTKGHGIIELISSKHL